MNGVKERMPQPGVRRATTADVPILAGTLERAFEDYPWTDWMLPETDRARRRRESFGLHLAATVESLGEVWMTDDGSTAAAWLADSPESLPPATAATLARRTAEILGGRSRLVADVEDRLQPFRLSEPHWSLATVGTAPEARGRGLATQVLQPGLRECDLRGIRASLETSAAANVRLYRRLGFEVSTLVDDLPHGAPPVWLMVREPRSPHQA